MKIRKFLVVLHAKADTVTQTGWKKGGRVFLKKQTESLNRQDKQGREKHQNKQSIT